MGDAARSAVLAYAQEFLQGVWDSVAGFPAVLHLDDQPAVVPRREQPTETPRQTRTVFSTRRASQANRNNTVQKEESRPIAQPKSYKFLFTRAVSVNGLIMFAITVLHTLIYMLDQTEWPFYLCWIALNVIHFLTLSIIKILSVLWFGDISKGALNYRRIVKPWAKPINDTPLSISENIADLFYGTCLEFVVLIMSLLAYSMPAGPFATICGFFITSQLNALYAFDYIMLAQGYQTKQRVAHIENHWPYFLGFGSILTVASSWTGDFMTDGLIFAGTFILFIISACQAEPPTGEKRVSVPIFYLATIITDKLFNFGSHCLVMSLTAKDSAKNE